MCFKRSYVIDGEESRLRDEYSKLSSAKLRATQGSRMAGTPEHGLIEQMLYERDFWRRFWTSGVVAWVSLGISLLVLILHLSK
jgi:hypothetical protein